MIRILINHPDVEMAFVHSKSNAGKFLYEIHEDLAGETDQRFDAQWRKDIDVLFLCLGMGRRRNFSKGKVRSWQDSKSSISRRTTGCIIMASVRHYPAQVPAMAATDPPAADPSSMACPSSTGS